MGLHPSSQIFGYPLSAVENFLEKNDIDSMLTSMLRGVEIDLDLFKALKLRMKRSIDNEKRFNIEKFLFYLDVYSSVTASSLKRTVEVEDYEFNRIVFWDDDANYAGIRYCIEVFIEDEEMHQEWINSASRRMFIENIRENKKFLNNMEKKPNFVVSWLGAILKIIVCNITGKENQIFVTRTRNGLMVPVLEISKEDSAKWTTLLEQRAKEEKAQAHVEKIQKLRQEKWLEKQGLSERILRKFMEQILDCGVLYGSLFAEVQFSEEFYDKEHEELKNIISNMEHRISINDGEFNVFAGKYRKIKFDKNKYAKKFNQKSAVDFFGNMVKADEDVIFRKTTFG